MVHPLLKAVPRNRQFWVADGRSLRNLEELALALQDMDETTFRKITSDLELEMVKLEARERGESGDMFYT